MLEFEKKVIEIADYICAYGLNHSGVNLNPPRTFADLTEEENNLFMKTCHIGFKKGQDMILENLLEIQEKLSLQKINLKTANRNNDKELSMTIQKELDLLKHKSNILRHLADAIAWNLIKHQLYIARKLHTGEQDDKTLNNSNLQSVIKVVDKVNENPMSFALISDITSYIQIGDVLCNDNGILSIIEVKEGDKNREVGEIVHTMFKNNIDINEINKDNNLDKNEEKHIKRYYNQMVKMNRLSDILNKDEGLDPKTGTQVKILTPQIPTEDYLELLHNMHLELEEKTWSYNIIENCLHIGMYRGENRFNNGLLLQIFAKE